MLFFYLNQVASFKVLCHSLPFIHLRWMLNIENWPKEYKTQSKPKLKQSAYKPIQHSLVHTENLYILTCTPSVSPVLIIPEANYSLTVVPRL